MTRASAIILATLILAAPSVAQEIERAGLVRANGIELAYQIVGPDGAEPLLFIQGVGGVTPTEPDSLSMALADEGFQVILFDNRDSGTSTHMNEAGMPDFEAIQQAMADGEAPPVAYSLDDMANDVIGLLDALGIERAHIVGGSLGGMIAQILAADHPERVTTLTLISSTTGNPMLAQGEPPAVEGAMEPAMARQSAAATTAGDLRPRSAEIAVPTVVIHGEQDQLFPAAHGSDLVATIPDARHVSVPGMGHVPEDEHNQTIIDAILSIADQVSDASPKTD